VSDIDPKLSRLYREASTEGPPPAVDAAILAAARKRVAQPERRARASWLSWMAPASAIVTLVLGVSVALLVEREQPEPTRETPIRPILRPPQSAPPARAAESAQAKPSASAAPAAAKAQTPAAAAPAQVPVLAAPAQAPMPAAPAAQAFPAETRAKASAPATMLESNAARDAASAEAGAGAPSAAAARLAPLRQPAAQRSAEAWLEDIGRLKRDGHDKEAAQQLAEFRKAYPAYSVPEALLK
jgi:hypothetical protein